MTNPPRPPIDLDAVSLALGQAHVQRWQVRVVPQTGSTNDDLAAAAAAGAPDGEVLVTDLQTAGKGRLGRRWSAPSGSSLAVSVLLRPTVDPAAWGWLPLLTGLAAVDAVTSVSGLPAALKWPNDVVIDERKLGGLLAERVQTPAGDAVVLGIGLNTTLTADELPVPTATSLLLEGAEQTDRTQVLGALLVALAARLGEWERAGGDPEASGLAASYRARCVTIGQQVRLELPGGHSRAGLASDVDAEGRLVVGGDPVSAGDVTHLR